MKQATAKDITREQRAFVEAWELLKKYYYIQDDEDQWAELIKEANETAGRDTGALGKLKRALLADTITYIDEIARERSGRA